MNYFEIMGLPVSFHIDEGQLRKQYYENSKKYHPDFHTLSDGESQEKALELSTLNNQAFKALSSFDSRFKYILTLTKTIVDGEKYDLSPDFLMEMMEINEKLMELQFDFDNDVFATIKNEFLELENLINDRINNSISSCPVPKEGSEEILKLKDLYYRKKYLLRIKENLDKLASP